MTTVPAPHPTPLQCVESFSRALDDAHATPWVYLHMQPAWVAMHAALLDAMLAAGL